MAGNQTKIIMVLWFIIKGLTPLQAQTDSTANIKNVLYINSYNVDYTWSRRVTNGLAAEFAKLEHHNLYPEFMDSRRNTVEDEAYFYQSLNVKYSHKQFDMIIASDNAALNFVLQHIDDELFKDKPIVFCGISNPEDYDLERYNLFGVIENTMLVEFFNLVWLLKPDLKSIFVITDQTTTGLVYQKQTQEFMKEYNAVHFNLIDTVNTNNLNAIIEHINSVPDNIIFYLGVTRYTDGSSADDIMIAKRLGNECQSPVFSSYIADVNEITAGRYSFAEDHGKTTALLALQILNGSIPDKRVFNNQSSFIFNYEKIRQFKLKRKAIPSDSVIINQPVNVWRKYRTPIIWISLLILVLFFALLILIRYIAIQKKNRLLIEKARDKALESDKLKGAFLANVSHELRTPLNAISGFSELALTETDKDHLNSYLHIINQNTQLLTDLVNDILDLSIIDAKEVKLHTAPINLEACFKNIHAMALSLLTRKNKFHLQLIKKTNVTISQFIGDELRISQIVQNFLSNAIKNTNEGCIIFGYDYLNAFENIAVNYPEYKNAVIFFVEDTGIGIDPKQQKVIFERFSRGSRQYQSLHGGFGLGLHISKALSELMGGEIYMKSELDKGSFFGLILKNNRY